MNLIDRFANHVAKVTDYVGLTNDAHMPHFSAYIDYSNKRAAKKAYYAPAKERVYHKLRTQRSFSSFDKMYGRRYKRRRSSFRRKRRSRSRYARRPKRTRFRRAASRLKRRVRRSRRNLQNTAIAKRYNTHFVRKWLSYGQLNSAIGLRATGTIDSMVVADLSAVGAYLQYVDYQAGLVEFDPTSITTYDVNLKLRFKYTLVVKNAGQTPVTVKLSKYKAISNTAISRNQEHIDWVGGYTQEWQSVLPTKLSVLTTPLCTFALSDNYCHKRWKKIAVKNKHLNASGDCSMTMKSPWFTWNTIEQFEIGTTMIYRPAIHSEQIIMEMHGAIGNSTTLANEVGYLAGLVNYVVYKTLEVRYEGGADKSTYLLAASEFPSTWTTAGVCTLQPVSDNLQFSRA